MKYIETIEEVTEEILKEEINRFALKNKLENLMSMLLNLTKLDLSNQINKEDISFDNGIALSSTFAAMCVVDIIRTRQFIRGIFEAVKQVRHQKTTPIRILYAGTGPFATLILPLLTKYNSDELQLILLEVNEETSKYLKRLIKKLEMEDYIEGILCEDASKYKVDKKLKVDILISETMQHGLVKEQQVPIMLNLVSQLDEDVIMIPNKIQLDLALMNTDAKLVLNNMAELKYKVLKTLLEFDKQFILAYSKQSDRFELCKDLQFRGEEDEEYDRLVVLTSIQVYGNEWITVDRSSLTIPKILLHLERIKKAEKEISLDYVIKRLPDFEYELN